MLTFCDVSVCYCFSLSSCHIIFLYTIPFFVIFPWFFTVSDHIQQFSAQVFTTVQTRSLFLWGMVPRHWAIGANISRQHSGLIFKGQNSNEEYSGMNNLLLPYHNPDECRPKHAILSITNYSSLYITAKGFTRIHMTYSIWWDNYIIWHNLLLHWCSGWTYCLMMWIHIGLNDSLLYCALCTFTAQIDVKDRVVHETKGTIQGYIFSRIYVQKKIH